MIHIPKAQEILDEDGRYRQGVDDERWNGYLGRTLNQLEWWAAAAREQRAKVEPNKVVQTFKRDPSQRNAP